MRTIEPDVSGHPAATVIIPTFNRWTTLRRCLDALAVQTLGPSRMEVVVVDDGSSTDGSAGISSRRWPFELMMLRQHNQGPAAARNRALAHASAPLTIFVNDDTILAPDAIERHVTAQEDAREPTMVLGRFDFVPDFASTPLGRMLAVGSHLFQYEVLRSGDRADHHFVYTCNLSVPTAAARGTGFDESFTGPAGEDLDFGLRLQSDGFSLLFDGGIGALHDHRLTVSSLTRAFATRGEGAVTFVLKHRGRLGDTRRMAAELARADRDRLTVAADVDAAATNLERLLEAVGPGEPAPRAAWEELNRLSSAASVQGSLSHPAWRQLAA
jgi:GT2 family glycosyltransferase